MLDSTTPYKMKKKSKHCEKPRPFCTNFHRDDRVHNSLSGRTRIQGKGFSLMDGLCPLPVWSLQKDQHRVLKDFNKIETDLFLNYLLICRTYIDRIDEDRDGSLTTKELRKWIENQQVGDKFRDVFLFLYFFCVCLFVFVLFCFFFSFWI